MNEKMNLIRAKIGISDALIVIDGQFDFVDPAGALYVAGNLLEESNDEVIRNILKLAALPYGYRATTEDDHPPGHIESTIFPPHCVHMTTGQLYINPLRTLYNNADKNIPKGGDADVIAYSVATSDHFPAHISALRQRGIKRIFVVGWAYTHCVGESAIAYASQGFEVFVVRDATRSVPAPYGDADKMQKKLELYGVKEIFSQFIE